MSNLLPIYFLVNLKFATVCYFKIGSKHPWEKKKKKMKSVSTPTLIWNLCVYMEIKLFSSFNPDLYNFLKQANCFSLFYIFYFQAIIIF